jgi:hypothetical protein
MYILLEKQKYFACGLNFRRNDIGILIVSRMLLDSDVVLYILAEGQKYFACGLKIPVHSLRSVFRLRSQLSQE